MPSKMELNLPEGDPMNARTKPELIARRIQELEVLLDSGRYPTSEHWDLETELLRLRLLLRPYEEVSA